MKMRSSDGAVSVIVLVLLLALIACSSNGDGSTTDGSSSNAFPSETTSTPTSSRPTPTVVVRATPTSQPDPVVSHTPVPTLAPVVSSTAPVVGVLPTPILPVDHATPVVVVQPTPIPTQTVTPTTTPTPTPTSVPTPIPTPTPLVIRLPFDISDTYDPVTRSQGDVSFAGDWVVVPFGGQLGGTFAEQWMPGENPDIVFELVPGTVLTASVAGRIVAERNPVTTTPEGNVYDPQDWEVHIQIDNSNIYLGYDHVVELQVVDGQTVDVGDPIGRASPAAIRHGGPSGLNPVDEVEWGLRRPFSTGAEGLCPLQYMPESDRAKLQSVLVTMAAQGFVTGDSACLKDVTDG